MYEAEVRFYSDLSREAGIRVPHIHIRFRECGLSAFDVNGLHEESAAERGVDWRANAFDGLNQKLELNRVIDTL